MLTDLPLMRQKASDRKNWREKGCLTQSIRGISAHHGEEDMVKFMVAVASSLLADQETEMVRTKGQAFMFTKSIPVT